MLGCDAITDDGYNNRGNDNVTGAYANADSGADARARYTRNRYNADDAFRDSAVTGAWDMTQTACFPPASYT